MTWRITGTELLDATELEARPRRQAEVYWEDGRLAGTGWALDKLDAIDGTSVYLGGSAGTPVIDVDLSDSASAYWATCSLFYGYEVAGDLPAPTWVDETPEGALN